MSIRPEMAAFDGGNVFDRVPELPDPGELCAKVGDGLTG